MWQESKKTSEHLKKSITSVPDHPAKGMNYLDLTPIYIGDLRGVSDLIGMMVWDLGPDLIGGIGKTGIIFGSAICMRGREKYVPFYTPPNRHLYPDHQQKRMDCVPWDYVRRKNELEAGRNRIVLIDDVMRTGKTMEEAADLATEAGYEVIGFAVVADIRSENKFGWRGMRCRSLVQYE